MDEGTLATDALTLIGEQIDDIHSNDKDEAERLKNLFKELYLEPLMKLIMIKFEKSVSRTSVFRSFTEIQLNRHRSCLVSGPTDTASFCPARLYHIRSVW